MPDHADRTRKSTAAAEPMGVIDHATAGRRSIPVQRLADTAATLNARPALVAQRALAEQMTATSRVNRTGMPDGLKADLEAQSALTMDDVRVHRNSAKPAQLQAHAYAQGTDIHLAPGQERHLPHEAWHVVQQKQGRVKPTMQLKGVGVNDDPALEAEADRWHRRTTTAGGPAASTRAGGTDVLQPIWIQTKAQLWHWDKLLSGVRWFSDGTAMWFEVAAPEGIPFKDMQGFENRRTEGEWLALGASQIPSEDEVFTDSDSDPEDPRVQGFRVTDAAKKKDRAEFDRVRFTKSKVYEDKTASFDQSKTPLPHRKSMNELVTIFVKKHITDGISKKITVAMMNSDLGIREDKSGMGMDEQGMLQWLQSLRSIKIVVAGEGEELGDAIAQAVLALRTKFPAWTITAKLGDPKAREDSDMMHAKK